MQDLKRQVKQQARTISSDADADKLTDLIVKKMIKEKMFDEKMLNK